MIHPGCNCVEVFLQDDHSVITYDSHCEDNM